MTALAATPGRSVHSAIPITALGVGAGCISGLQPLLLDLLLQAGKLDVAEIGMAATGEAAGMALAMTLAAAFLDLQNLRKWALLALAAMALANAGTLLASGYAIIGLRFINGLGAGMLLWVLIGMLSRSSAPARLFAIYVTVQSVLGLCLSQAIGGVIAPQFGHVGAYGLLLALNAAMVLAVPIMADSFAAGPTAQKGLPGLRALTVLSAMSAFLAGIMGLWVYLVPMLTQAGYSSANATTAISVGLAAQIAGGLLAALLAPRLDAGIAWSCGIGAALAAIVLMAVGGSVPLMLLGAALFGFVWIFVPPFHMPAVLAVDRTGRGGIFVGTAQLCGTVVGPLVTAQAVARHDVGVALPLSAAWLCLSLLLITVARFGKTARQRNPS